MIVKLAGAVGIILLVLKLSGCVEESEQFVCETPGSLCALNVIQEADDYYAEYQ